MLMEWYEYLPYIVSVISLVVAIIALIKSFSDSWERCKIQVSKGSDDLKLPDHLIDNLDWEYITIRIINYGKIPLHIKTVQFELGNSTKPTYLLSVDSTIRNHKRIKSTDFTIEPGTFDYINYSLLDLAIKTVEHFNNPVDLKIVVKVTLITGKSFHGHPLFIPSSKLEEVLESHFGKTE